MHVFYRKQFMTSVSQKSLTEQFDVRTNSGIDNLAFGSWNA